MSPRTFIEESRTVGIKKAWASFVKRRHLLPALAYLVLAFFTAFSFAQERTHSNENRNKLATETHNVLYQGCLRGNDLRLTLQQILSQSASLNTEQLQKAVKSGQITSEQADKSIEFINDSVAKLKPVDCDKAYPKPKLTTG